VTGGTRTARDGRAYNPHLVGGGERGGGDLLIERGIVRQDSPHKTELGGGNRRDDPGKQAAKKIGKVL